MNYNNIHKYFYQLWKNPMTISELIFIPFPDNLLRMVEFAKLLLDREPRLSVTIIIIMNPNSLHQETYNSIPRLRFIDIPCDESAKDFVLIEYNKFHVKKIVQDIIDSGSVNLAGFIVDMYNIHMMDVANEFGVPTYTYVASSAALLGLMFYMQGKRDYENIDVNVLEMNDVAQTKLWMSSYYNPIPVEVLRHVVLDKEACSKMFLDLTKRFRKSNGFIINTFLQLERRGMRALSGSYGLSNMFSVGPILNLKNLKNDGKTDAIVTWLDDQPESSVVFICFGSVETLNEVQVKEIAIALENSGQRFLWSEEYEKLEEMLPKGFLERTSSVGKVIKLGPKMAVLSHPSMGAFFSHFEWNSILESICSGVPMVGWPINAEQQLNAFQMGAGELGLVAEIKVDYQNGTIVTAEEILSGINKLMNDGNIKKNVKEMKQNSRLTVAEGGSSYYNVQRLIDHLKLKE